MIDFTLERAVREITKITYESDRHHITMPLLYPDGTCVLLDALPIDGGVLVSDTGGAGQNAQAMGLHDDFFDVSERVADDHGIDFYNDAFSVMVHDKSKLGGAIVIVANASKEAVDIAFTEADK